MLGDFTEKDHCILTSLKAFMYERVKGSIHTNYTQQIYFTLVLFVAHQAFSL